MTVYQTKVAYLCKAHTLRRHIPQARQANKTRNLVGRSDDCVVSRTREHDATHWLIGNSFLSFHHDERLAQTKEVQPRDASDDAVARIAEAVADTRRPVCTIASWFILHCLIWCRRWLIILCIQNSLSRHTQPVVTLGAEGSKARKRNAGYFSRRINF